jgi:hypothetical protein
MIEARGCLGLDASRSLLSGEPCREGAAVQRGGFGFARSSSSSTQDLGIDAPTPSGRGVADSAGESPRLRETADGFPCVVERAEGAPTPTLLRGSRQPVAQPVDPVRSADETSGVSAAVLSLPAWRVWQPHDLVVGWVVTTG